MLTNGAYTVMESNAILNVLLYFLYVTHTVGYQGTVLFDMSFKISLKPQHYVRRLLYSFVCLDCIHPAGPETGHPDKGFLGFPLFSSEC
jgi:hypothetical protein